VPGWLRNSLVLAAVIAAALLLWVGFALLVTVLLVVAIPFAIWSSLKRRRAPEGPVIIEGSATRVNEKIVLESPSSENQARSGAPRDS
jgi:hypothetical protein